MDQPPLIFWVLGAMVIVWFIVITVMFRILKSRHPAKYKEMGEPTLFRNNSIKTGWATTKFLYGREHRHLGDSNLSLLCDSMLVFFVVYLVLFFGLVLGFFQGLS